MSTTPLGNFPIRVEIPVAWGEMDCFSHVNNVVYARWFETARIKLFERAKVMSRMGEQQGPILARTAIDYRLPLVYPDNVTVAITCSKIGNTSFEVKYRLTSEALKGAVAAEGDGVIVMYDYKKAHKIPIWPELKQALLDLEASAPVDVDCRDDAPP
jgi:acyl-CoA thioester hydrolase